MNQGKFKKGIKEKDMTVKELAGMLWSRLDKVEDGIKGLREDMLFEFRATDERFIKIESRLDKIEFRLDNIEFRLDKIESRLDVVESRLDNLESKFDALGQKVDTMNIKFTKDFEKYIIL